MLYILDTGVLQRLRYRFTVDYSKTEQEKGKV